MKTTNIKSESGKISLWEKLSYSGGDVASCITFGAVSSYLSYYYTDIAGISIAAVGVIFGVTRLLEALVNFLTGVAPSRTAFPQSALQNQQSQFWACSCYLLFWA